MRREIILAVLAAAVMHIAPAVFARTPSPANAQVYFIWPSDGTVIHGGKFWLRMGLRNMGVAPKGTDFLNTGHHHLLIDTDLPPADQSRHPGLVGHRRVGQGRTGRAGTDRRIPCLRGRLALGISDTGVRCVDHLFLDSAVR